MNQEEFEKSIRLFADSTFKKININKAPRELMFLEKEILKESIKKSITQFEDKTGINVDKIEAKKCYSPSDIQETIITIHLSSLV